MKRYAMLDNIEGQPASHELLLKAHRLHHGAANASAARLLRSTKGSIYVTGMGASLFAASPAVSLLLQHGYKAHAFESSELLHYGGAALKPEDVGILISRSGESVEVLGLAQKMRDAGMRTVGVTNVDRSPLETLVDVSLQVGAQADQIVAVQTYTGTIIKLLLMVEEVFCAGSTQMAEDFLTDLPHVTTTISACLQKVSEWQGLLLSETAPLYLLGRGPALGTAREGALLLNETAKIAAVSMSSGQFRHGPVETVSSSFRAIIIGTADQTRGLDFALLHDLRKMGSDVRWIGDSKEVPVNQVLMDWPGIHSVSAPLLDIIPLQIAAYHLALWRDIVPGEFRYASAVTATESGFPLLEKSLSQH